MAFKGLRYCHPSRYRQEWFPLLAIKLRHYIHGNDAKIIRWKLSNEAWPGTQGDGLNWLMFRINALLQLLLTGRRSLQIINTDNLQCLTGLRTVWYWPGRQGEHAERGRQGHNSDFSDIWEYTNCFKISGVSGIMVADDARSSCQPSSCEMKPPATLLSPPLFLCVLRRVSQIWVVGSTSWYMRRVRSSCQEHTASVRVPASASQHVITTAPSQRQRVEEIDGE